MEGGRPAQVDGKRAHPSVEAMLRPDALGAALGRDVTAVSRRPFVPMGWSSTDARFEAVALDGAAATLVLKVVDRERDWVSIATGDEVDREVWSWESGLLDRLPPEVGHAVVSCARWERGYAVLMRDIGPQLASEAGMLPERDLDVVLDGLAAMHSTWWGTGARAGDEGEVCSLATLIRHLGPQTGATLRERLGSGVIIDIIEDGWAMLARHTDPGIAAELMRLADDPTPVVAALAPYPHTIVHADVRVANVGINPAVRQVVLLDWARPTVAPPAIDVVYWLRACDGKLPVPHEVSVERYANGLARRLGPAFARSWWEPQLALSFLAVTAMCAPLMVLYETVIRTDGDPTDAGIDWWIDRASAGLRLLG